MWAMCNGLLQTVSTPDSFVAGNVVGDCFVYLLVAPFIAFRDPKPKLGHGVRCKNKLFNLCANASGKSL